MRAKAKNVFFTGKDCAKSKKDDLAKHEIFPDHRRSTLLPKRQIGLRDCERSREVGDYRLYVDRVDASVMTYGRFHTRKPSRSVKEQRPGFTGLVKRVDTVVETRVVVVDMVTFSVLEICSVIDFLVLYL